MKLFSMNSLFTLIFFFIINRNENIVQQCKNLKKPSQIDDFKHIKTRISEIYNDLKTFTDTMKQDKVKNQKKTHIFKILNKLPDSTPDNKEDIIVNHPNLAEELFDKTIKKINDINKHIQNIEKRAEKLKQKNKKKDTIILGDDQTFISYNSLSLLMISLLAGGLIGVIFVLYLSLKPNPQDNNMV